MLMPERCGDSPAALEAPPASDSVRGVAAAEAVAESGSSKPSGENIWQGEGASAVASDGQEWGGAG